MNFSPPWYPPSTTSYQCTAGWIFCVSFLISWTHFAWMPIPQNRATIHVQESSSAYIHHPLPVPIHSYYVPSPPNQPCQHKPTHIIKSIESRNLQVSQVYPPARPSHAIKKLKREPICTLEDATDQLSTNRPGRPKSKNRPLRKEETPDLET
jgi:hypothetical protein